MNKIKAEKEIKRLSKEIERHNDRYYNLDEPSISDKEYDDLLKKFIDLEGRFPELKNPNSPGQRVGTKIPSGARTVTHREKMYSLDNMYSIEELKDWHGRVVKGLGSERLEYVTELKIDGVSASLTYQDGQFVLGATRGDGVTGEDVTHSLRTVRSIPLEIKKNKTEAFPHILEVRGEVYMNRKDFEALNFEREKDGETLFANPRNAVSGSVKLLDSRITAKRKLHCFIHSFGMMEGGSAFKTQWDFLKTIREWGLVTNTDSRLCRNLDEVISYCEEFEKKRDDIPYEMDGVVIKVNSFGQQRELGATLKSPRWAVAFKFRARQATTTVREITVQVGRTGVLTPVAELDPVECGGVVISRSTLHNFDEIKRLGINRGDRVLLERAGDVIPKIIKVVEPPSKRTHRTFQVPKKCPECGAPVIKDKKDDVAYYCKNPLCPGLLERGLVHFASRGAMDIEGLGESAVQQLLQQKMIKDFADIYFLKKEDLLKLPLFKDKKAENLLQAIERSKKQPLSRFLFGLGINNVGEKVATVLAQRFQSLDKLMETNAEDLNEIHEIGQVIARSVAMFFRQASTKALIDKFKKAGVNLKEPSGKLVSHKLSGKTFVFTGELSGLSRTEAANLVKQSGGQISSSVSKNTDFLVVGEAPGSKYQKAVDLGLNILSEQQFREMVNG